MTTESLQKQRTIEMAMTTRPDGGKISRRKVMKKIMEARQAAGLSTPVRKVRR